MSILRGHKHSVHSKATGVLFSKTIENELTYALNISELLTSYDKVGPLDS